MQTGLTWLESRFGVKPSVGWQIDPFGNSKFTPTMFKELGFDFLVLNRIGDRAKDQLKRNGDLEFYWNGYPLSKRSKDPHRKSGMFSHVIHIHYDVENWRVW